MCAFRCLLRLTLAAIAKHNITTHTYIFIYISECAYYTTAQVSHPLSRVTCLLTISRYLAVISSGGFGHHHHHHQQQLYSIYSIAQKTRTLVDMNNPNAYPYNVPLSSLCMRKGVYIRCGWL